MDIDFSSLQTAMITELTDKKDETTETVLKRGPSVDVVAEAYAGPKENPGVGKTLAYLIPIVEYLLTNRDECPRFPRTMPTESTNAYAKP